MGKKRNSEQRFSASNQVTVCRSKSTSASGLGMLMLSGIFRVAKKQWKITLFWTVGLLLAFFATGFAVSEDEGIQYEMMLRDVDVERVLSLSEETAMAYEEYYENKGWVSCDETCKRLHEHYLYKSAELAKAQRAVDEQLSAARKNVGIFSTYGVSEARQLFWKRFGQGKDFAKRQSIYDTLFTALFSSSRDEGGAEMIARVIISLLINFTMGMLGATVGFVWTLYSLVSSFQPGFVVGPLFFCLAVISACAVMALWLVGFYTAVAGSIVVVGKVASAARIEGSRAGQRPHVQ